MRNLPGGVTPALVSANTVTYWNFVSVEVGGSVIRYTDRAEGDYTTTDNPSFADVPSTDPYFFYIEALARNGLAPGVGCAVGSYCPDAAVTRKEMAVFLLKAEHGSNYAPPACAGIFADVTCPSTYAAWIEQLYNESITAGCGGSNYCPDTAVTRAQMAVFLLKTRYGSGYTPPAATGTIFSDVAAADFAANYIEDLYKKGIAAGCGGGNYCPGTSITRRQLAVYIVRAFGLSANINIDGVNATWQAFDFVLSGPVQSQASPLDVSTISFQNLDNVWSDHVFIDGCRGARVKVYQGWFDSNNLFLGAMLLFDGRLDDGQIQNRATFSMIPHATPWSNVSPGRTYTATCQYVFKDKKTCQYVGPETSCLKTVDYCRSLSAGSNEIHFGGFLRLPPPNFKYIWGDIQVTPPAPVREDAQTFSTPIAAPIRRLPTRGDGRPRQTRVVVR